MTEHDQANLRAYIEGRNAFRDGLLPDECPYEEDLRAINWDCGYEDAFAEYTESYGS